MSITREDLDRFHRFAEERLGNDGTDSIAELARQWQAAREREEVNEALRDATEDLKAGRYRTAADVSRDIDRKFNLPGR
ncbi:MAG: hypothetical protein L0Z07_07295 [Planctomycetes bacterium]|nr:hypothetical protein [Planctomycetota bacterium]